MKRTNFELSTLTSLKNDTFQTVNKIANNTEYKTPHSNSAKQAKGIMNSLRKEIVKNLLRHNMNKNNLNFDVNFVMNTFLDEEAEDDSLEVMIRTDIEKLFS